MGTTQLQLSSASSNATVPNQEQYQLKIGFQDDDALLDTLVPSKKVRQAVGGRSAVNGRRFDSFD
jgi:hypothetical protein